MVDLHSHILPGLDDGAQNIEEALILLREACMSGTSDIVMTPHANIEGVYENYNDLRMNNCFNSLKQRVAEEQIPIHLHMGMEVMASADIGRKIDSQKILPICNSKYVLVEFPFDEDPDFMFMVLHQIDKRNLIPIIAHPERYDVVKADPEIAYEWNRREYILQINKGSILGELGTKTEWAAGILLENNLCQLVASDCHSKYRTSNLKDVYYHIAKYFSHGYAELLLEENPKRVLENREVLIINPKRP